MEIIEFKVVILKDRSIVPDENDQNAKHGAHI